MTREAVPSQGCPSSESAFTGCKARGGRRRRPPGDSKGSGPISPDASDKLGWNRANQAPQCPFGHWGFYFTFGRKRGTYYDHYIPRRIPTGIPERLDGAGHRRQHQPPACQCHLIVKYWWDVDKAAKQAIRERVTAVVGKISFEYKCGLLRITLPSGRELNYVRPKIEPGRYGDDIITYDGLDVTKHWDRIETYGPKLVEKIVQAISRDLLADAMKRLWQYPIVGHVHDEVIIEEDDPEEICRLMSQPADWLPGLKLKADGYTCRTYRKD